MEWFIKQACAIIYQIIGWKTIVYSKNRPKKFLMIVAPHTSNWDFIVALLARYITGYGFNTKFIGKHTLFNPPFGFIFYALGGLPVDRSKNNNLVEQVVEKYKEAKGDFGIALAPEGTRKYIDDWKKGFYHIAIKANIPIIPVGLDFKKKETILFDVFYPTGDIDADITYLKSLFKNVTACHPENYNYNS
ncbi:MAG: 1-acyl-sn-glycerol-3-phosphate acyltransferase [Thermoflexibacter sp.]|nr:1-acyl-sn-glycerol-3-phosphate acyltransferase [Thermoflexibacter sp.]